MNENLKQHCSFYLNSECDVGSEKSIRSGSI